MVIIDLKRIWHTYKYTVCGDWHIQMLQLEKEYLPHFAETPMANRDLSGKFFN